MYTGRVANLGGNLIKACLAALLIGLVFASAPSASAQSESSQGRVEPVRTPSQAQEIIDVLSKELAESTQQLKTNETLMSSVEAEAKLYRAELADESRSAAAPAVDGFILSENIGAAENDPSAQLRARFIGSKVIADDEETIRKIRSIQSKLETSQLRFDLLQADSQVLESAIFETQTVLDREQAVLGRISERAIHDRGRDGATRTLVEKINNGGQQGFYLATCPVNGPHNAIDSWGAPRSSGRSHQGIDIMASVGVPVVAPVSGQIVLAWGGNLGGNVFRLTGDNGVYYYGAHLDSFVGSSRRVEAGELVGYVGKTGNAQYTAPHLHFEIRPGGRSAAAINPTPDSAVVCGGVDSSIKWRG